MLRSILLIFLYELPRYRYIIYRKDLLNFCPEKYITNRTNGIAAFGIFSVPQERAAVTFGDVQPVKKGRLSRPFLV